MKKKRNLKSQQSEKITDRRKYEYQKRPKNNILAGSKFSLRFLERYIQCNMYIIHITNLCMRV